MPSPRRRVFLYLTRGNALLVLRHVEHPDLRPEVPGGTIELGELPAVAALREAREETGLEALGTPELLGTRTVEAVRRSGAAETLEAWYYRIAVGEGAPSVWRHWERHASGGGEDVLFELSWAPLAALPPLSDFDRRLIDRLGPPSEPLVVRHERRGDERAIGTLTERAFAGAPHASGTEHLIVAALREAGALSVSLVAALDGRIVGHVALSSVALSGGEAGWFGLGPISVAPERQRRGLGTRLVRAALDELRSRGASGCVLIGDPRFYARVGFVAETSLDYPGVDARYVQALPFGERVPSGVVAFHDAFDAAG